MPAAENGKIVFCPGCPIIPSGVTAELIGVDRVAVLQGHEIGRSPQDVELVPMYSIHATALQSTHPGVKAGHEAATSMRFPPGVDGEAVIDRFRKCPRPKTLGGEAVCGASARAD